MNADDKKLMTTLRELAKKKVRQTYVGPWGYESGDFEMSLDEFLNEVEKMLETKDKPKMKPHSDYGDRMPFEEFEEYVKCGAFIPDDGSGVWATETLESDLSVWCIKRPEWATHVMWYNR